MTRRTVPLPDEPFRGNDEIAQEEAQAFPEGNLEERSKKTEHVRREIVRNVLLGGALILLSIFLLMVAGAMVTVAWHHLLPVETAWLQENQLTRVETFLFSGISGAVIGVTGTILRRYTS